MGSFNEDEGDITAFFMNLKAVAWSTAGRLVEGGAVNDIWRSGAAGAERIEGAAGVDPGSLAMSADRRRFFWTSGETARSAELR